MKKLTVILSAVLVPFLLSAQAQITTKKVKIGDFAEKTTKIVLSGNTFFDAAMKDEMRNRWVISPYEFCTIEEFETLKTDPSYYFLVKVKGQFRRESEPGIEFLSLMKGDPDASEGMGKMLDLVTFPYAAASSPSGRETVFLPFILDAIQQHVLASQENDLIAYGSVGTYTADLSKTKGRTILMAQEDLSSEITPVVKRVYFKNGLDVTDADTADDYAIEHEAGTVVSYTVCAENAVPGSYCYKMLFDTETGALRYFRRHRITRRVGPGFLLEDVKRIAETK